MLFISFFTNDNYRPYAIKLKQSLEKHKLDFEIVRIKDREDWNHNNATKVPFILSYLKKHKEVCWLDCDCEIISFPELLFNPYDLAVLNWYAIDTYIGKGDPKTQKLLSSGGVMAFREKSLELLEDWARVMERNPKQREDQVLDRLIDNHILDTLWLPKEYNRMHTHWPEIKPVINHYYTNGTLGYRRDGE